MPVRKMRDIAEAESLRAPRLHADNLRAAFELSEVCFKLRPQAIRRGVRRYRSIEDAAAD